MVHKYSMALGIYAGGQMADFSSISRLDKFVASSIDIKLISKVANVMTVQAVCQKSSIISVCLFGYINKYEIA